jgi:flavodoxin
MNVLIIYDTAYGNTEQLAQAMGRELGAAASVRLQRVDKLIAIDPAGIDLLLVGGPTHRQRMSPALTSVLANTERGALKGVRAAAFDTRYRMAAWLSGSAARRIARQLRRHGARLVAPPESFFIARDLPPKGQKRRHELEQLEPGEVERAARWAALLAQAEQ